MTVRFEAYDREAFDRTWAAAEERDPEAVDAYVRAQCNELERQFVFDQEEETDVGL
jgi:hypothetical protein